MQAIPNWARSVYQTELSKACFQHAIVYHVYKDLSKRTASDNVLREKKFAIASNLNDDGYQRGLASMVYNLFDKTSKDIAHTGTEIISKDQQLVNELHKSITKKSKRWKMHSLFKITFGALIF